MPEIRQLEPHVADLIAAGEVVERAASVVKELVENAIDAGSSAIVVELQRGGMGMIRVTDNGCGISAEQLPTAFLRHATSKIRTSDDLSAIGTLGFRGEALAAIASVSRVDILSRIKSVSMGASLHLEGGIPGSVEPAGAPEGTSITIRDLFFNTPARLKFVKKDSAESAAISGLLQHLALSRPDISFRLIRDGIDILHTPGDNKLDSVVYSALGRDFAQSLVPIQGRRGDTAVSGLITQPLMSRRSRGMQVFFVNGRFIKSQLLTSALEEGYRNQILKGRFPGCVLSIKLPTALVDVNVHPAKTVVKFAREKEVFDALYYTVLDTLGNLEIPEVSVASMQQQEEPVKQIKQDKQIQQKKPVINSRQDFFQNIDARQFRQKSGESTGIRGSAKSTFPQMHSKQQTQISKKFGKPAFSGRAALSPPPSSAISVPALDKISRQAPEIQEIPKQAQTQEQEQIQAQTSFDMAEPPWRIVGELFHTYIICEGNDNCIYLIDKHAAHERMNFDRLKSLQELPVRQVLIQPIFINLRHEDIALLLENQSLLEQFGFACEFCQDGQDNQDGSVKIQEVPADIRADDTIATLEEFAENLRTCRSVKERREALLRTIACKASIQGGWTSDLSELQVLVEKVQSGAIRCCPHGRPVAIKFTRQELEKLFKRT